MNTRRAATSSIIAATGLTLSLLCAAGCEEKKPGSVTDAVKATEQAAKDAAKATGDAVDKAADAASAAWMDARKQLVDGAQPKLDALKTQITAMKDKAADLGDDVRPAAESAMTEIEKQYDAVVAHLGKVKDATADNFNTVGTELGVKLEKLMDMVKNTAEKFGLSA